jgi:hypothetical protein
MVQSQRRYIDTDAEVVGALAASETFLSHARDEVYKIPDYHVIENTSFLNRPSKVTIDADHDGKPDGVASITYTTFGMLDEIQIDRDNDGRTDSKFVAGRNLLGLMDRLNYDFNNDGKMDATTASLYLYGSMRRNIVDMNFEDTKSGKSIGSVHFRYGLSGLRSFTIALNSDGKPDCSGAVDRKIFHPIHRFGRILK